MKVYISSRYADSGIMSDNKRNKIVLPDRFRSLANRECRLEKRHSCEKNLAQVLSIRHMMVFLSSRLRKQSISNNRYSRAVAVQLTQVSPYLQQESCNLKLDSPGNCAFSRNLVASCSSLAVFRFSSA
jgi:hypothetical protein